MQTLTLGFPATAEHEASAAAVARVLEAHEHEVATVGLRSDAVAGAIASGDIDLLASAWLPLEDALVAGGMRPLGLLYRPMLVWCVAADGPASIADLAGCAAFDRRIVVPASGLIASASARAIDGYALSAAGYVLDPLSEADARDPTRIVALTQPHALLHSSGLRPLADPLAALGPTQEARLLIRDEVRQRLDPDLIDELDELTLGNKVVSAMAHAIAYQAMSAEAAADAWQRGKLTPR